MQSRVQMSSAGSLSASFSTEKGCLQLRARCFWSTNTYLHIVKNGELLTVVGHSFDRTFNLGRRRLRLKLKPKSLVAEQFLLYLLLRDLQADFDVLFYDRLFVCFCGSLQEVNELVVLLFQRHLVLNDTEGVCRWRISNGRLVE